jgi:hypothetical protein
MMVSSTRVCHGDLDNVRSFERAFNVCDTAMLQCASITREEVTEACQKPVNAMHLVRVCCGNLASKGLRLWFHVNVCTLRPAVT